MAARNDALALAGYSVVSPKHPQDVELLLAQERFDAVIIGHSIEPPVRHAIIATVRTHRADMPVIFAYSAADTAPDPVADISVDIASGPGALLLALEERLRDTPRAAA
ncbi:MAG: hypothetical protein JOY79_02805 [Acidobacteriaceae bacterium]|nr:hypothetical protein [Acidobacteriaceae bacterium]